MIKRNFIFMKCILILGNYCSIIEHKILFWLSVTRASIFYFQIWRRVTCGILVTPVQLSQNVLRQLQVTGWADLALSKIVLLRQRQKTKLSQLRTIIDCCCLRQFQDRSETKIENGPRTPSQFKDGFSRYGISIIKIRRSWEEASFIDDGIIFHNCPTSIMKSSNGNILCVAGPLCGEFTGHQWILLTKAIYAELWCFLWSALEQTAG